MISTNANILDAYGLVNVISPSGLPIRGIVGISPDPIMLLAINCENVKESKTFYEKLGFVEQVRFLFFPFYCRHHFPFGRFFLLFFLFLNSHFLLHSFIFFFFSPIKLKTRNIHFHVHLEGRQFLNLLNQRMQHIWHHQKIVWDYYCYKTNVIRR